MKARRLLAAFAALAGIAFLGGPANAQQTATGEILALQDGYVFLTSGKAYKALPDVRFTDASGAAVSAPPALGTTVTITLDPDGRVSAIALAATETARKKTSLANATGTRSALAALTFVVRVPATTGLNDLVYLTSGDSNWNPLAVRMDRIDALHFRTTITAPAGARFRYLYTRGNSPTIERGANGLQRAPRVLAIAEAGPYTTNDVVEHWGDEVGNGTLPAPQATPTPYNPAPFPNLPIPVPAGGHAPGALKTH
jgi:hypothetical protein